MKNSRRWKSPLAEEIANGEVEVTIKDNEVVVELKGPGSVGEAEHDKRARLCA